MPLTPEIRAAIEQAAREQGMNPAYALAVAERESQFDPNAKSSKTIQGIYQMQGAHRDKYGVRDSRDPYTQASGWGRFQNDVRKEMAGPLGRDPTDAEAYLGHHFGGVRAGRMMKMDPNTPVDAVFTKDELDINPHIVKAGTVGNLNQTTVADINKRMSKYGDGGAEWKPAGVESDKFDIDPNPYKADFSDGASPAGFENAAAVPPEESATGQQIAADAGTDTGKKLAKFGSELMKKQGEKKQQEASLEHIPLPPAQNMAQYAVGGVPTAPVSPQPQAAPQQHLPPMPPQQGQDPALAAMLGNQPQQLDYSMMGIPV